MKKLVILFFLAIACEPIAVEKQHKVQNTNFYGDISEVEYKGHTYIIFSETVAITNGIGVGVVHDPDCYCMK